MKRFKTEIIYNKKITFEHYLLSFKMPKKIGVKPGQFFNIRIRDSYEPFLRRPFGAHKIDRANIEILYKTIGKATKILSGKKTGDTIDVLGPLGNGFDIKRSSRGLVALVGGGHGIAPLYALAKKLKNYKLEIIVFIGAKTKKHVVCDKDFRKLGSKGYVSTDDGTKGYKGLVTDLLEKKIKNSKHQLKAIYACGPKPMLKEISEIADRHDIPCQVSMEEYLGCGTGICMGCVVKTRSGNKLVCKDGPVFNTKELIW